MTDSPGYSQTVYSHPPEPNPTAGVSQQPQQSSSTAPEADSGNPVGAGSNGSTVNSSAYQTGTGPVDPAVMASLGLRSQQGGAGVPNGNGGAQDWSGSSGTPAGGELSPPVEIKLFVGRVPRTADQNVLRPIFAEFGQVTEVAIIKDRATQMHKGSAFVRMASITQADAAVRALNNIKVLDPQLGALQVRYATGEAEKLGMTAESAYPGQDQAKLFVGSLPRNITEEEVRSLFSRCGQIDEVFIMKDATTGMGKGCAFVKFAYKEQALQAIKQFGGVHQLPGAPRPLEVRFAESKKALQASQQPVGTTYNFAGGATAMPRGAMTGMPVAASSAGQLMPGTATPMYGQQQPSVPATTQSPAYSNVNPRCAGPWKEYFTDDGRPYYHNDQTSQTQWERPPEFDRQDVAGPPGANIFVFHVPNEWTQNDLYNNFQHFGQIVSARIATDKATGRNKGYAFVSYNNIQSAAHAVQQMNGFMAGSKRLKVSIKQNEEMYVQHLLAAPQGAGAGGMMGGSMAGGQTMYNRPARTGYEASMGGLQAGAVMGQPSIAYGAAGGPAASQDPASYYSPMP